jgi:hypothetical protein
MIAPGTLRPSHPAPNVRDDREAPLLWARDGGSCNGDLGLTKTGIFFQRGLDGLWLICPAGANLQWQDARNVTEALAAIEFGLMSEMGKAAVEARAREVRSTPDGGRARDFELLRLSRRLPVECRPKLSGCATGFCQTLRRSRPRSEIAAPRARIRNRCGRRRPQILSGLSPTGRRFRRALRGRAG